METPPRRHWGSGSFPDPRSIQTAADILAEARNPLIITSSAGRSPENVEKLVALSDSFAIPVVAFNPRYMCFPTDHPMHAGFSPAPFLNTSDAILVVDCDVPWYPDIHHPSDECRVIHMGIDPLYTRYPIRSFPCDLALRVDPAIGMPMLTQALKRHRASAENQILERSERVRAIHDQQRIAWRNALAQVRDDSPIDPLWLSHCIDAVKDDSTVIFNEYDLDLTQVAFDRPGTLFGNSAAGGLGWGLGAALGAKLAAPDRLIIATLGDGSYMFGNPTPSHFVSRALKIPTLTVIFNNSHWNAVRMSNIRMYPDGWAAKTKQFPLSQLEPSPRYELLATASGGYGERVDRASEVKPALERAVRAVREEGRQAVLNMILKSPQD
jgi:acetolactate synthase-1/2/3 large subunit